MPLPVSSLCLIYLQLPAILGEYWAQRAILESITTDHSSSGGDAILHGPVKGVRGKDVRRDGFSLAEERYSKLPVLSGFY